MKITNSNHLLSSKFLIIILFLLTMNPFSSCVTSKSIFLKQKTKEFADQPLQNETILQRDDITDLPYCVQKYLEFTGSIGKPKIQNLCLEFDASMFRSPGDKAMKSYSIQYNFFNNYSRLFLMKASKMGIPFTALHIYSHEQASFTVKVAEMKKVVDQSGEILTLAETVTLLNDMCIFAPGALIDNRLSWTEIDSLSTKVVFKNGKYEVSAFLYFNEKGELINFISDDRYALQDDGTLKKYSWSTPVSDYKEFNGRTIATKGKTIWHYPEGDYIYGIFELKNISYNIQN